MSHRRVEPKTLLLCCLTFFLFCSTLTYAQGDPLKFERFTTENGLSSNVVYCVLQDKNGFLWVGTNDGLNRYDGYNFKTYRSDPGDSSSLPANTVNALCEDKEGNLWIGTPAGICKYNFKKNTFTKVRLFNNLGAFQILLVNKEELVINTNEGYLSLNTHSLKSIPLQKPDRFKYDYYNNLVTKDYKDNAYITLTREDTTVIIKSGPAGHPFIDFLMIQSHEKNFRNSRIFFVDSRNNNWMGTSIEGNLFHYSPANGEKFVPAKCLVKKGIGAINQIFEDKDGKIWIAAAKGLFNFDYNTNAWSEIMYTSSPGTPNTTLTMSIFQDRNGLIWIGSYNGLFKINPAIGKFRHFSSGQHQNSLKDNFILGIYPGAENKVWINYHWGVRYFSLFDIAKKSMQHFPMNDQMLRTLIRQAYIQNPGYINENSLQKWMNHTLPSPHALPFFLVFDRQKNLWINSGNSLKKMGEEYSLAFTTSLMDEKVLGDEIWMATDGEGLHSFNTKSMTISRYVFTKGANSISNDHLTCLLTEKNGNIWIGTKGNGLDYFDREKNIFHHYTTEHGLSNNSVYSLVKDHKDRLWIGTANGLSCLDISIGKFKNFYRSDGLVNSEYNRYSACRLPDGSLFMGGMDGIDYFHPDSVIKTTVKPVVHITDFKVFNKSVYSFEGIRLAYDQNYITIDFASMDFRDPSINQYEYKLEGIDKELISTGTQHSVSYATLAPGHYRFLVWAVGNDGLRSEVPAKIDFVISTPWWKSTVFYIGLALFMLSVIFLLYKYRIRQLKRLMQLRTKISQDLHDDVGATLSGIRVFSQLAKERPGNSGEYLTKITNYSDDMLNKLNDIVWSLNPENDNSEQLMNKLRSYAEAMTAAKDIRLEFLIDPVIQKKVLATTMGKNIYMITREAINNAIKYAHCKILQISLYSTTIGAELIIKDDGKGFDKTNITPGNGLSNMYKRAEELNGVLTVEATAGIGTMIRLSVKFT